MTDKQTDVNKADEQNKEFVFLREEIKARPINKHKIMRNSIVAAISALVFGLVACVTFVLLTPLLTKYIGRNETKTTVPGITLPSETLEEEMDPKDMLVEDEIDFSKFSFLNEEQVKELISGISFSVSDYRELYASLANVADEAERAVVKVSAIKKDTDWFNNLYEGTSIISGLIVAETEEKLFILTYYEPLKNAESILVTFKNNIQAKAELLKNDIETGFCVISVSCDGINEVTRSLIKVAPLGSSYSQQLLGSPIIAVGSPMGAYGSLSYGIVTSSVEKISVVDNYYRKLQTDIYGSDNATGFLVTTKGLFVGVITTAFSDDDAKNLISGLGITDLRNLIERMSNGLDIPYFGIIGVDVPSEAVYSYGVPIGTYVKSVEMDSPAMHAGIQPGDIIFGIGNSNITNFSDFTAAMRNEAIDKELTVKLYRAVKDTYKELTVNLTIKMR